MMQKRLHKPNSRSAISLMSALSPALPTTEAVVELWATEVGVAAVLAEWDTLMTHAHLVEAVGSVIESARVKYEVRSCANKQGNYLLPLSNDNSL